MKPAMLPAIVVLGSSLAWGAGASAQTGTSGATAENAKSGRAWALKSGSGAPHNIMPSADMRGTNENLFLRMPKLSPDYVLGAGDTLDIRIVGGSVPGSSLSALTIAATGEIALPYVGYVQAAGLTAEELEQSVARLFEEKELLKSPEVLVYVTDYKANPIFVVGAVDNPGEYMMTQGLTLMEAILMAGGIDPDADSTAYLHRRKVAGAPVVPAPEALDNPTVAEPGVEIIEIDIRPLKQGAVPNPDIELRKGDLLLIPKAKYRQFYVLGDVRAPGPKEIPRPPERVVMVSEAIAQAGGPTPTAKTSQGLLIRYNEDGTREERKVDFAAILKGQQPDFRIQPDDIIFIPGSNVKTLAYGILGMIPYQVQRTVSSVKQ